MFEYELLVTLLITVLCVVAVLPMWCHYQNRALSISVGCVSLLFLVGGYLILGSSQLMPSYYAWREHQSLVSRLSQSVHSKAELIANMEAAVQRHPSDPKGWFLLGRLYLSTAQYREANHALKRAYELNPSEEIILNYVSSDYLLNERQLTAKTRDLLQELIQKNPNQLQALAILGMDAKDNLHDKLLANRYWQQAKAASKPRSEEASYFTQLLTQP